MAGTTNRLSRPGNCHLRVAAAFDELARSHLIEREHIDPDVPEQRQRNSVAEGCHDIVPASLIDDRLVS